MLGGPIIIWYTSIWKIWKAGNELIFSLKELLADEVVKAIKFISWKWFLARKKKARCLFL